MRESRNPRRDKTLKPVMDEPEKLNAAIGLISMWMSRVELSNAIDYFDINKVSEGLAQRVLNAIFGFNLVDLNSESRNFPAVDLGDDRLKIAIQVTATVDDAKVRNTFEKFRTHGLDGRFPGGIKFFLLSNKESRIGRAVRNLYPSFNPEEDIIGPRDIIRELKRVYGSSKEAFDAVLLTLEQALNSRHALRRQDAEDEDRDDSTEIPAAFKENLLGRLVGRLKLSLFSEISGQPDMMPSSSAARHFLLTLFRTHPERALLYKDILETRLVFPLPRDYSPKPMTTEILRALEALPIFVPTFFEGEPHEKYRAGSDVGFLIHRTPLAPEGWVYVVTTLAEETFPRSIRGLIEVRASGRHPRPAVCEFTSQGWVKYDSISEAGSDNAKRSLGLLVKLAELKGGEFRSISMEESADLEIEEVDSLDSAEDHEFNRLMQLVYQRKAKCAKADIRLAMAKPHDLDFCLTFSLDFAVRVREAIERGSRPELLVYWSGSKFVMSDDYGTYMAYRSLGLSHVPVVIMGAFPKGLARIKKEGSVELIPPAVGWRRKEHHEASESLKEYALDRRLSELM